MPLSKLEFVSRWKINALNERQGSQPHFIDLCDMLGQPHPAATNSIGERFAFDKPVSKVYGGKGFADVWRRDHFAWEYKGKHKDLKAAYKQLNDYREDLGNPPLLVVCDMDRFEVHTNFTSTQKRLYSFNLDDLARNVPTATCPLPPLEVLRTLFVNTDALRPNRTDAQVTQEAAKVFARLAEKLEIEKRSLTDTPIHTREEIAHFLMRLLFCLFADSIGLLPNQLFRNLIQSNDRFLPKKFLRKLTNLFQAMSEPDGIFGEHTIRYFNGGLFDSSSIIELDTGDLGILYEVSKNYNWAHIAPEIFGTLFERSLNKERRSLIGAHYTSAEDILLLIEPVLMQPLERRWAEVRANVIATLESERARQAASSRQSQSLLKSTPKAEALLAAWIDELTGLRVLDPACGSGNFLYLALRRMLDLWKEATDFAVENGLSLVLPKMVSPSQLFGIETEFYAHELASIVVWIGFLQWKHENGIHDDREPILHKLDTIQHANAILRYDETEKSPDHPNGRPYEPEWPPADFVIGNPPFLGGKKLRRELGDTYMDDLFAVHGQNVAAESDLVVYWFEKARSLLARRPHLRVGLLATQQIRKGFNQRVLKKVKETGDIFWALSDKRWFAEVKKEEGKGKRGRRERRKIAAIRVAMIGFDKAFQQPKELDGRLVDHINPDLTDGIDVTSARELAENVHLCYQGPIRVGRFDLGAADARKLLKAPLNVNGRPNSDVVRRYVRTTDLTDRPRNIHIIDFGTDLSEEQAAMYEAPFHYLSSRVKQYRESARSGDRTGVKWWRFQRPRPELRERLRTLSRAIATPRTSKHRFFVWVESDIVPDTRVWIIASEKDYLFGVLSSSSHEIWSLRTGTKHGVAGDPTYVKETCFDTFPFPWPPGTEPSEAESPLVRNIAEAARELVRLRDAWLNPPGASDDDLRTRTLTNLYNARAKGECAWLENAHRVLDQAVFAAYDGTLEQNGKPLTRDEILASLLALNHERAATQAPKLPKTARRKPGPVTPSQPQTPTPGAPS